MEQINNTNAYKRHSKHLTLKPDSQLKGLTIVISKKVSRLAVQRNKLRRRIKEIVRLAVKETSRQGLVVLGTLYTRKGVSDLKFDSLKKEVLSVLE